eukprot:1092531-Alexandrium_andersonii.AAC.1
MLGRRRVHERRSPEVLGTDVRRSRMRTRAQRARERGQALHAGEHIIPTLAGPDAQEREERLEGEPKVLDPTR